MSTGPLANVVVVLDRPRDVVNIAGVVRAMLNTGLSRLRLVEPDDFDAYRIEGIAHRSGEIIEATEFHDTLVGALGDAIHVVGTSARARAARWVYTRPRKVAPAVVERAREGTVALVFGRETRGLTNDALDLCHEVAIIPTPPDHSSLNLAQACLILCHEVFLAAGSPDAEALPRGKKARLSGPATRRDLERMYEAFDEVLERIGFYGSRQGETVLRPLRALMGRARPSLREAKIVAAIGYAFGYHLDRLEGRRRDDGVLRRDSEAGEPPAEEMGAAEEPAENETPPEG